MIHRPPCFAAGKGRYLRFCGPFRHGVDDEFDAEGAGEAEGVGEQPVHAAGDDEAGVHGDARPEDALALHPPPHRLVLHLVTNNTYGHPWSHLVTTGHICTLARSFSGSERRSSASSGVR